MSPLDGFMPDESTDHRLTPLTRRRILATTGAMTGGLATIGLASGGDPNRQTEHFEYKDDDPNDYYVRTSWLEDHSELDGNSDVPIVLMMDGYMGAGAYDHPVAPQSRDPPSHYVKVRDDELIAIDVLTDHPLLPAGWALAWGSIRGTGCSSGAFNLFDDKHAVDGCEVIDWLADRPWTNDRIGLFGASYSGITALHIASKYGRDMATDDIWNGKLTALSANMVVGDLYRDIVYPGGVPNSVFPAAWTKGIRPAADAAGTFAGLEAQDEICAQNLAHRSVKNPTEDPLVWYTKRRDGVTWRNRSTIYHADAITVPTYISHAWQDEQTGPRAGVAVYDTLDPDPVGPPGEPPGAGTPGPPGSVSHPDPKLLRTTNGVHNTAGTLAILDAKAWFEYWLLGETQSTLEDGRSVPDALAEAPVVHHFGATSESLPGDRSNAALWGSDHYHTAAPAFPDPGTDWQRFALDQDERLRMPGEGPGSGRASYVTGSTRQSWSFEAPEAGNQVTLADGPDVLTYRSPTFTEPTTVAGPINAVLHVTSTAAEMDLFVRIADEWDENGETRVVPLQRGLLRASFREIGSRPPENPDDAVLDGRQTWYTANGEIVRPYRPHTNIHPIVPGQRYRYDVEVFPLAHTFRPGHRLVVRIHTPPSSDGLWGYEPSRAPGVNVVHHHPGDQAVEGSYVPSSVLIPVVDAPISDSPVDYDSFAGYREMGGYGTPAGSGLPGSGSVPGSLP